MYFKEGTITHEPVTIKGGKMMKEYFYDAFISYRHVEPDITIAKRLHKVLERSRLPKSMAYNADFKKITRVFRDQDELPTSSDLNEDIHNALKNSRYLIVVCSANTPKSKWCCEEIETFRKIHGSNRILSILIEGEPQEAFPSSLRFRKEVIIDSEGNIIEVEREYEPLAADIRGKNLKEMLKKLKIEKLRLLAPMFGVRFDDLRQRHREQSIKRAMLAAFSLTLFFAVFGGFSYYQMNVIAAQNEELNRVNRKLVQQIEETEKQRDLANKNGIEAKMQADIARANQIKAEEQRELALYNQKQAEKNEQEAIIAKNTSRENEIKAIEQRNEALRNESKYLTTLSYQQLQINDKLKAMTLALQGLPKNLDNPDRPYVTETGGALLSALYSGGMIRTTFQHEHDIYTASFSPDGSKILTMESTAYRKAHVWDFFSGRELLTIDDIKMAQFSPDGKSLLVSGTSEGPQIYDIKSGKSTKAYEGGSFETARYNADGSKLLTIEDKNLKLWNVKTKKQILSLKMEDDINIANLFYDDKYIIVWLRNEVIQVWNTKNGSKAASINLKDYYDPKHGDGNLTQYYLNYSILHDYNSNKIIMECGSTGKLYIYSYDDKTNQFKVENKEDVKSAKFSKDGKYILAIGKSDQLVKIWDAESSKLIKEINMGGNPKYVHMSNDNSLILAAIEKKAGNYEWVENSLWDARTGVKLKELDLMVHDIRQAVFNPQNTNILTISSEKNVKLLDIEEFRDVTSLSAQDSHFLTCEYSPDGTKILTLTADGVIQIWDSKSGRQLLKMNRIGQFDNYIKNIGYIQNGSKILVHAKGIVKIFDASIGSELTSMNYDMKQYFDTYSSDGKFIATTTAGKVHVWSVEDSKEILTLAAGEGVIEKVIFSSNSQYLMAYGYDDYAYLWELKTGKLITRKLHCNNSGVLQFSSDSKIAIIHDEYSTQFIDTASGNQIEGKSSKYHGKLVSYTENGDKLIEIADGKVINVWDAETDKELLSIELKANEMGAFPCTSAALSPDGKMIITSGAGGIRIWDAKSGIELFRLSGAYYKSFQFKPDSRMLITLSADEKKVVLINLDMNWVIETAKRSLKRY